jgi:hypothetical protein
MATMGKSVSLAVKPVLSLGGGGGGGVAAMVFGTFQVFVSVILIPSNTVHCICTSFNITIYFLLLHKLPPCFFMLHLALGLPHSIHVLTSGHGMARNKT